MKSIEALREVWLIADSDQVVKNIHPTGQCSGACVVHRPTDHLMRKLELSFDTERAAFQRTCLHGFTHQDPDERVYWTKVRERTSGKKSSLFFLAIEKLNAWACPFCPCGCCDITGLVSSET